MDVGVQKIDAKCIMRRKHAELLESLNSTWTSAQCFCFGILYWDVWYFGREEGWNLFMSACYTELWQYEKCLVQNKIVIFLKNCDILLNVYL